MLKLNQLNTLLISTPDTCSGSIRLDGHRLTVKNIQNWWDAGMTVAGICSEYNLREDQVVACLRYDLEKDVIELERYCNNSIISKKEPICSRCHTISCPAAKDWHDHCINDD